MSGTQWWRQPDDLPETQPDTAEIRLEGQAAITHFLDLRARSYGTAWRFVWAARTTLLRSVLLRVHGVLDEVTNLILPPLFTLLAVNLANGGRPSFGTLNLVFSALFFMEWVSGLLLARSARAYLGNVWLLTDLVSSLPLATAFQALRYLAGLMATALFDPEEDEIAEAMERLESKLDAVLARLPEDAGS